MNELRRLSVLDFASIIGLYFFQFFTLFEPGVCHPVLALVSFSCYLRQLNRIQHRLHRGYSSQNDSQTTTGLLQIQNGFSPVLPLPMQPNLTNPRPAFGGPFYQPGIGRLAPVHHLATISALLTLLHHVLCDMQFALFYAGITFIPTNKSEQIFGDIETSAVGEFKVSLKLVKQREFAVNDSNFGLVLALTVVEVVLHWCQSWVVYLWKKPCCYFAEKFPM